MPNEVFTLPSEATGDGHFQHQRVERPDPRNLPDTTRTQSTFGQARRRTGEIRFPFTDNNRRDPPTD